MAKMLGKVDLLGLNAMGQNPGLGALSGVLIGGGVATGTSLILKKRGAANADMWGFVVGLASAGAMYYPRKTRHAAVGAAVGAVLATGLPWVLSKILGAVGLAGLGVAQVQYLNGAGGLGVPEINYLNGLGIPGISAQPPAYGAISSVMPQAGQGFAGVTLSQVPPIDLLGPATAQSQQVSLLGGPPISGLAAAYGATLLGGGR